MAAAGLLSPLSGTLPYVPRHITVNELLISKITYLFKSLKIYISNILLSSTQTM